MVTLEQAKNYLKIDSDITDDDNLVTSLINAAGDYVKRTTGKINTNANSSQLYDLCVKMLVAHWYETELRIVQSREQSMIYLTPLLRY